MANTKNHALLPDQKIFALIIGLCDEISKTDSSKEAASLLASLLTPQEIRMLSIRLQIRKMLLDKKGYQHIKDELGVSAGTISRVRLSLEHIDKRPRLDKPTLEDASHKSRIGQTTKSRRPKGPLAKYSSGANPVNLLATVLREIAEKRPPP